MTHDPISGNEAGESSVPESVDPQREGLSRRALLFGGGGLAVGAIAGAALAGNVIDRAATSVDAIVPWRGAHQAGIVTTPQGFLTLIAFDLADGVDALRLERLLRIWTDGIDRLTQGRPGLTDTEPELAAHPARLTCTVGLGSGAFTQTGLESRRPVWLRPLPEFANEELDEAWSGGDLVLQVCGEDPSVVAHAARFLAKDVRDFTTVRWTQNGFRNAAGQVPAGTFRNQFGQLDGSQNLQGEEAQYVFIDDPTAPAWLLGGSTMVVRRIRMNLDTWDELDRPGRENAVGRRLDDGAPLTGGTEASAADLDAKNALGFPVIDQAAHIRRSRTDDPTQRFLRRPYTYQGEPAGTISDTGQVWIAYQKDIEHQYIPVQRRQSELDLLNVWITPIGSAVFAVPRGVREGEFLAQDLFG